MKTRYILLLGIALLFSTATPASESVYKRLQVFFDKNFPGEGYVPAPYGADDRFAPKVTWMFVKNVQDKAWKTGTDKAWVAFSDGNAIYPSDMVPIHSSEINPQNWDMDKETKWSLAASLSGNLVDVLGDNEFKANYDKTLEIDIDLGEVEVQYAYYFDFILAQNINNSLLETTNAVLRDRFNDIPDRRVIISAIRVKNPQITVKAKSNIGFSISAEIKDVLSKIGLSWSQEKNQFQNLNFDDWRYIGYVAMITDEYGKISSANNNPELNRENVIERQENHVFNRPRP